ncbi:MAG: YjbQ family protein [Acidobacteria bacterium]|nr:YjbQ family protein [Acidobacteriota bacterium]
MSHALHTLRVETRARTELKDITAEVAGLVAAAGVESGLCCLYVPHTTAGILVNENDDPDVAVDIADVLERLAPRAATYKHFEGNADSHVKAALVGTSQTIPLEGGRLALGRWQGIFFCEFDGPRKREVKVKILRD